MLKADKAYNKYWHLIYKKKNEKEMDWKSIRQNSV